MQVTADFNRDGIDDLLQVNADEEERHELVEGAFLYYGTADGGLAFPGIYGGLFEHGQATFVAVGDLNGDGWLDFITTSGTALDIEINQRDAEFMSTRLETGFIPIYWNNQTMFADLDGDGRPDLVACASNGIFVLFDDGGAPNFGSPVAIPGTDTNGCASLAVADLNADGQADIESLELVDDGGAWNMVIRLGMGDGGFLPAMPIPVTNGAISSPTRGLDAPVQLTTGDLNGDGLPDLLWPTTTGFALLPSLGGGAFGPEVDFTTPAPYWTQALTVADFNGDSLPDVATVNGPDCDAGSFAYVFLNEGDGGFAVEQLIAADPSIHSGIAAWRPAGASLPSLILGSAAIVINDPGQWFLCYAGASILPNLTDHDGG
jgi:hypothetical protein